MRKEKFFKNKSFNKFSGLFIVLIVGLIALMYSEPLGIEKQLNERDKVEFDIDFIISDEVFTNVNSMSIEQIQSFLEEKNSPLADKHLYQKYYLYFPSNIEIYNLVFPNGKLAWESSPAEIIYYAGNLQINPNSRPNLINPKLLIVLLELNQGLIEDSLRLDQYTLDNALKYNSIGSEYYNPNYQGFLIQLIGMASQLTQDFKYFKSLPEDTKPITIIDGIVHHPKNAGTYALQKQIRNRNEIRSFYSLYNSYKFLSSTILYLDFPLKGFTPYNSPINAVFDHSMNNYYKKDEIVIAYTEEKGEKIHGYKLDGYKQKSGEPFEVNGNYTAAGLGSEYLFYDGHPGIDYRASLGTGIYAPADGIASVPSYDPVNGDPNKWNTLKIDHGNGWSTWYLHCLWRVVNPGETQNVKKGITKIATVGDKGTPGSPHLHFEVRKNGIPVDPYGWQGSAADPYTKAPNVNLWGLAQTSWGFNTDRNTENWTATNAKYEQRYEVEKEEKIGIFYIDPGGGDPNDPYISSPPLRFDASVNNVVCFRMKRSGYGPGDIYFKTAEENNYSEDKKVSFSVPDEAGSSVNYHCYPVPMGNNEKWKGTITGIRIDPVRHGTSINDSDAVRFDWISIGKCLSDNSNSARQVSNSGNITVKTGEVFDIWFKVENNGSSIWTEKNQYRLGWRSGYEVFPNYSSFLRIHLLPDEEVGHGQSKLWEINGIKAPNTSGPYPITWQMVQGEEWFGDKMSINVIVQDSKSNAPSNLRATAVSSSRIDLSWQDNSDNEDGFKIERKTGVGGSYSQIEKVGAGITRYSNTGLSEDTTYYYRVKASNSYGDSDYSNEAHATTPSEGQDSPIAKFSMSSQSKTAYENQTLNLTVTSGGTASVDFSAQRSYDPDGEIVSYTWKIGGTQVSTSRDFNLDLGKGTHGIYLTVKDNDGLEDSVDGTVVVTEDGQNPPATPSNLTATAVSSSRIDLSWKANSNNEDGFKIERKTGAGGSYSQIATVGAGITSYSNTGLSEDTTYYYRVKASNSYGDSDCSNEAHATTTSGEQNPTLLVSPTSGKQGTTFNYSGSGYTPNGIVEWHVSKPDGTEYPPSDLTGKVDGNGNFSHSYKSHCDNQVGIYTIWAIDKSTGKRSNDVKETITVSPDCDPQITYINPAQVTAKTFNLEIYGKNFDSGAVDQIYWKQGDRYVGQGTIISRTSTKIVTEEHMSGATTGTYYVKVKNSDGKLSNGVDLVITSTPDPEVSISPSSGNEGTKYDAPGSHFSAYGTATLHLKKPNSTEFPTLQKSVDKNGNYSHTIDSTNFAPGTYYYWAIDNNRNKTSNTVSFNVKALDINYQGHFANIGWGSWYSNGTTCGTPGGNQMEAIKITVSEYGITYRAHVAYDGWLSWASNGTVAGTTGQGKALEAIEIKLVNAPSNLHVSYRTYVQGLGWQSWVSDGATAGTTGQARAVQAIEIKLQVW